MKFKTKNLINTKKTIITPEMICNRNCENFIGATQVPLGVAGPLQLKAKGLRLKAYWLPLATTEGALVASVNRGCKATRLSGGIKTYVENIGATRAPLFRVKNLAEGQRLAKFAQFAKFAELAELVKKEEPFITLLKIETYQVGRNVWLRCFFDTSEAMGMNMATIACQKITDVVKKELGIDCLALSGNLCVDKKPSWLNFTTGRGKKVWAEAVIKKQVVSQVLKTTPEKIVQVVQRKCHLGSLLSGSLGFNAHFANITAALFLATGQDIAHLAEASLGITDAEVQPPDDLYISVYLPNLMVGTIGGGTGLPTQKEALEILGFDKSKKGDALVLAQIAGAAVLAGELSLTAAIASGHLARAHQELGRGKEVEF